MKRFTSIASFVILILLSCPVCGAQESGASEDLALRSGRRVTPSLRVVLPLYVGASMLTGTPQGNAAGVSFGLEMIGLRLSARSSPLEAGIGLRWGGMVFQSPGNVFHLGVPLRLSCRFGARSKVYLGAAAGMRVGGSDSFSRFAGLVEGGVSFYGFGLRASCSVTPVLNDSRVVSLGLMIGL